MEPLLGLKYGAQIITHNVTEPSKANVKQYLLTSFLKHIIKTLLKNKYNNMHGAKVKLQSVL
jgi:hypothetical protein